MQNKVIKIELIQWINILDTKNTRKINYLLPTKYPARCFIVLFFFLFNNISGYKRKGKSERVDEKIISKSRIRSKKNTFVDVSVLNSHLFKLTIGKK